MSALYSRRKRAGLGGGRHDGAVLTRRPRVAAKLDTHKLWARYTTFSQVIHMVMQESGAWRITHALVLSEYQVVEANFR